MIQGSAQIDKASFKKWSKKFGDSSNDALVRLSVAVSRELAIKTAPPGRSKKKQIQSIIAGARANIITVSAREFRKIANASKPAMKINHQWVRLREDQILRSPDAINEHIEKNRGSDGRVRRLQPRNKAVCRRPDMNKTLVRRKRLAGVAKGSWIGAGNRIARYSGTVGKVGRNFLAWARKHADKGTARFHRRLLGKSESRLISKAPATKDAGILSRQSVKAAIRTS